MVHLDQPRLSERPGRERMATRAPSITCTAIAVDAVGNAYITGSTSSNNFPVLNPFQPRGGGFAVTDGFVVKLSAIGVPRMVKILERSEWAKFYDGLQ